jgi:Fur family ferric uptake transcriptional regulator
MAGSAIQESLRGRGVRLTRQRLLLLELIDNSGLHLDAESLFQMAKERDPKLNRVTVYRTLKMLKEGGLVDELDLAHLDGEKHYYETRLKQEHAHVICLRCGRVEEFFGEPLQAVRGQVQSQLGFEIVFARTEIGGYCSHCQALRAQEARAAEPSKTEGARTEGAKTEGAKTEGAKTDQAKTEQARAEEPGARS